MNYPYLVLTNLTLIILLLFFFACAKKNQKSTPENEYSPFSG